MGQPARPVEWAERPEPGLTPAPRRPRDLHRVEQPAEVGGVGGCGDEEDLLEVAVDAQQADMPNTAMAPATGVTPALIAGIALIGLAILTAIRRFAPARER